MARLLRRVMSWIRYRQVSSDLLDEIEHHRAARQQQLERAGMSPTDAAAASRRALGNVTLAREDARAVWIWPWLGSVWQDATYALRLMRQAPGFAAAMIVVMALGIGAATAVFGLIDGLVLRSLPVRDPDRLVWFSNPSFSYRIFAEVRARGSELFSGIFAWDIDRRSVEWTRGFEPVDVLMTSGTFYSTLGVTTVAGRTFTEDDDRMGGGPHGMVAVISYACWQRRFGGSPSVIGTVVRIDTHRFTIVGVTPVGFFGVAPGLDPEITIPLTTLMNEERAQTPSSAWLHLMGRLRDAVTLEQANVALQTLWPAVLDATTDRAMPADRRAMYLGRKTALESGRTGFSRVRNQFEEPLWILQALVGLLLTVAWASAANLLLARGVARRREVAIRLAIGAGRSRLVRQMLTESLVWTTFGAGVGLLVAVWSGGALVGLMRTWEEPIALDAAPNGRVLAFTSILALLTSAVCAVLPTLRTTQLAPGSALKQIGPLGAGLRRRWSLGKSLVAAQVALTVVLLAGAGLFGRSLHRVLSQEAGFERDGVLVVSTDALAAGYTGNRLVAFYDQMLDRLGSVSGVESASLSWYPPISDEMGSWTQNIAVDGDALRPEPGRSVFFNAVSPGYFRTVGITLLEGRDFVRADTGGAPRVVIVNEFLARKFFGGGSPLGHRVSIGLNRSRQNLEIVGVVQNAKYRLLQEPTRGIAYLPCAQLAELMAGSNLVAELRTRVDSGAIAESVRREIRSIDGSVPVRMQTVRDRIRESLVKERVIAILATVLGLSSLALACAGLYGLLAYAVSRQTSEIGLRLALGATRSTVLTMVLRESLALAAVGIPVGIAAALALGRFARNLLYQVSPTDPASLAASAVTMLLVAACAGLIPARRAAAVDPVIALRCD